MTIELLVQLEERTQSMPLLGFVEGRHFDQALPQHAFHPAFSMPLPEVIGWPEEELSASFCCQGGATGLPQGSGVADCQPSLRLGGSMGAPGGHAATGQRDAYGEAGPPVEHEEMAAEAPQQSDRSDGTGQPHEIPVCVFEMASSSAACHDCRCSGSFAPSTLGFEPESGRKSLTRATGPLPAFSIASSHGTTYPQ